MCRQSFLFICLLTLLAACTGGRSSLPDPSAALPGKPAASVAGKVTDHRNPAAGVRVMAFPVASSSLSGRSAHVSDSTAADGLFRMNLPPGEYYLLARGEKVFSFYGRNPVAVPEQGLDDLNLGLVTTQGDLPDEEPFVTTGVTGRVLHGGRPLEGATVYVYTDLTSRLKGMGYVMAGPTDETGFFEAALPAGTYYLLARLRRGSAGAGPLRAGDFIGYYPGNPLSVEEGAVARLAIPMLEVPDKVNELEGHLFGQTSIGGRILDRLGQPVAGARAVLYDDSQMLNRPRYVSRPTAKDGHYVLSFPYGGTYYLGARDTLGGAPGPGDLYGTYDVTPDHSLKIESGQALRDVDVVVEEMW
jgi:hypothetical protein